MTNPHSKATATPATEPTARERLDRIVVLARRGLVHWKIAALLIVVGCAISISVAMRVRRTYTSECTVALSGGIRTNDRESGESSTRRAARLKDMLTERARLESTIKEFHLYAGLVDQKGMLDAVDAMRPHVGFRARESGRYVISFDSPEVDDVDTRALVQKVAQSLADSLAAEYASGNILELRREADFMSEQVRNDDKQLEVATRDVTVFLSQHPEYAVDLRAGAGSSLGVSATPIRKAGAPVKVDPAALAIYANDPQLGALVRERDRLDADMKANAAPTPSPSLPIPSPADEQAAQLQVDAAMKRFSEAQADVLAKSSRLTPDHPDMKAAQATADAATQTLRDARNKLAGIKAQQIVMDPGGTNPYAEGDPAQLAKLKEINAQIAQRESILRTQRAQAAPATSGSADAPAASAPGDNSNPQIALESEWQKLLRVLTEAKSRTEDMKRKNEAAQLSVRAAEATAKELLTVVEPAFKPTTPTKGGRTPVALAGLILALGFAGLYAGARVAMDDRIIDAGDVTALDVLPILGVLPRSTTSVATAVSKGKSQNVG